MKVGRKEPFDTLKVTFHKDYGYVAVIKGMWRLNWYVAVILVCGGYIDMWRLYLYVAVILDNCTSRAALGS